MLATVEVEREVKHTLSPDGSALSPPLVHPDAPSSAPVLALDEDQIRARTPHVEQLLLEFYVCFSLVFSCLTCWNYSGIVLYSYSVPGNPISVIPIGFTQYMYSYYSI